MSTYELLLTLALALVLVALAVYLLVTMIRAAQLVSSRDEQARQRAERRVDRWQGLSDE
jgi:large-conductance mechanosensitive channel